MRKYGKYEKRPDVTDAKRSTAKGMLLQTYLTGLVCMVLCAAMFLGTSYAWFTSETKNYNNEIYIGILDVDLVKVRGDDSISLSSPAAEDKDVKVFDGDVRWQPGYTALEEIKVVNRGDLAFNYTLTFTNGTVTNQANETLQDETAWKDVARNFEVWVYDHRQNGDKGPSATSYEEIKATDSGWAHVGSLADVLSGTAVFEGTMEKVREKGLAPEDVNKGTTDGVATEDTYTIALHMNEGVVTSVMGYKISLNVKLIAYQLNQTADSITNGAGETTEYSGQ